MTTRVTTHDEPYMAMGVRSPTQVEVLRIGALIGRIFFAAIFILASFAHFTPADVNAAVKAGVPMPSALVPLAGVLALVGGLSILLGYHARIGAILLIVFLVPVTLWMHAFWGLQDPMAAMMQKVNFMKNLSMLGGALLILYFGAGPFSLDEGRARAHPPER